MKSTKLKTKTEKGITLVALIITIVVLMILAVVAINSITNDGIISQADGVKDIYTEAQNEEQKILSYYELVLSGKAWTQNGTKVTRGNITLEVGDNVNYTVGAEGYTDANGWKVLGAENGKLLLVSASNVKAYYTLSGTNDYFNGISKLDSECSKFLNETYASKARSINVDDINRVTGYNPNETATGRAYHHDINEKGKRITIYGNTVTFKVGKDGSGNTIIEYAGTLNDAKNNGSIPFKEFVLPDGTKLAETENNAKKEKTSVTLNATYYYYYADTLCTESGAEKIGIKPGDSAYQLLFVNGSSSNGYFLASRYQFLTTTATQGPQFGIWAVDNNKVTGRALHFAISDPGNVTNWGTGIRAVIEILPDCQLEPNGANNWTLDLE